MPFTDQNPEAGSSQVTKEGPTGQGAGAANLIPGDLAPKSSQEPPAPRSGPQRGGRLTAGRPWRDWGVFVCFPFFFAFLKYFYI